MKFDDKLKLLIKQMENELNQTKSKLILSQIGSKFVSILTILLNLSTIVLSIVAIVLLSIEINKDESNLAKSTIIMPFFVACFTVALFIISISLMIYNIKTKVLIYDEEAQTIQYLMLKMKHHPEYKLHDLIDIFNKIKEKELKSEEINYQKVLVKALETRHEKK